MGENINIRTIKDLKAYLDDKIDKLASSETISDIKTLVQEQSNLILELTETVNSQKERIHKLEKFQGFFFQSFLKEHNFKYSK